MEPSWRTIIHLPVTPAYRLRRSDLQLASPAGRVSNRREQPGPPLLNSPSEYALDGCRCPAASTDRGDVAFVQARCDGFQRCRASSLQLGDNRGQLGGVLLGALSLKASADFLPLGRPSTDTLSHSSHRARITSATAGSPGSDRPSVGLGRHLSDDCHASSESGILRERPGLPHSGHPGDDTIDLDCGPLMPPSCRDAAFVQAPRDGLKRQCAASPQLGDDGAKSAAYCLARS